MKSYFLFTTLFVIVTILSIFKLKNHKYNVEEKLFFVKDSTNYPQLTFKLKYKLRIDSFLNISLIDGNYDGKLAYSEGNDPREFDYVNVEDINSKQFDGIKLKDSFSLKVRNKNYIIRLDIKNKNGVISSYTPEATNSDIVIIDQLPSEQVYNYNRNCMENLKNITSENDGSLIIKNWAPYCEPCIKDIPIVESLIDSLENEHINMLYLVDTTYKDYIEKYFKKSSLRDKIYLCDYNTLSDILNLPGLPSGLYIDKNKKYVRHLNFLGIKQILEVINKYE